VGAVFARCRMILENGTPVFLQRERPGKYDFDDLLVNNNPTRSGSALLIKKSCFEDVGGFDENLHYVEDFECWLRIAEGAKTPLFWANRQYLVDQRLRPGQVTKDRSSSDQMIFQFLAEQTPKLQRFPVGLAYVRPAVMALKHGADNDITEKLAANARTVGVGKLAQTSWGRQFLIWDTLPPSNRQLVRRVQRSAREAVKSVNRRIRG
jgi:glycosyl transferase family 2